MVKSYILSIAILVSLILATLYPLATTVDTLINTLNRLNKIVYDVIDYGFKLYNAFKEGNLNKNVTAIREKISENIAEMFSEYNSTLIDLITKLNKTIEKTGIYTIIVNGTIVQVVIKDSNVNNLADEIRELCREYNATCVIMVDNER